ncbi:MAG: hypothetical protein QOE22_610 [Candidatus Parcubacteria bacterium]|jgi:hypothetical protein|nr:hypothetical protein [Candidatus Parcubacteria bacterium]
MRKLVNALLTPLVAFALIITSFIAPTASLAQSYRSLDAYPAICRSVMTEQRMHGTAMYRGADNPAQLAEVIQASLDDDETGMTRVRAKPGDQAFARPIDWFCTLKAVDSRAANLNSVADLPAYMRTLVAANPPQGRVWSACITQAGVLLHCMLRHYEPNEKVWVNPQTAVGVMQGNCANTIEGPEVPNVCYVFEHNYYQQRDVRWFERGNTTYALVSTHMSLTEQQMRRVYADDCYFVEDETGRYKPRPDCPFLFCPPGSTWPNLALARAVGLPASPPDTTIHYWLANGRGRLSVPLWAARILAQDNGEVIPCVYTVDYFVSVAGFERWRAFARFDRARGPQIRPTLRAGRYSEVFQGRVSY